MSDFANTDVFAMAAETGIPITRIYKELQLVPDPTTQRVLDAVRQARTDEERSSAFTHLSAYQNEMGTQHRYEATWRSLGKEELAKLEEGTVDASFEIHTENGWVLKSPFPLGEEMEEWEIRHQAETGSKEDLLDLYKRVSPEHGGKRIVIETLALRFFQKPLAS